MKQVGKRNPKADLSTIGLNNYETAYWNLTTEELMEHSIKLDQGVIAASGALMVNTGEFTGRSPEDRFIVKDGVTANTVAWGKINLPFDADKYAQLKAKITAYLADKDVFVRDAYACADADYRLDLRLVAEYPWSALFANNMFLRPTDAELEAAAPAWHILCAPGFHADPAVDGTRQHNFAVINFTEKTILIGGTAYTGEIKKGIFSVLNFVLPHERNVLSMHCSANVGQDGDTALFFGLSGTGKTTLSADANRALIGDDEHGWSPDGVFNFEGGCYAKTIDLSPENEPEIFGAIKHGAMLENIVFEEGTRNPDFADTTITENTRVSYPIDHIENIQPGSKAGLPKNIFFLTCDAFGVLPPISKLTPGQAKYHFMSGYTAKVAGTEVGITEPKMAFSACFGEPFLPLHPAQYAELLGQKMEQYDVNIWLVNTGWTGGAYGIGTRMKLRYTRAMINAALNGQLTDFMHDDQSAFGLAIPTTCPDVPQEVLNPRNTWADKTAFAKQEKFLAEAFIANFKRYEDQADAETKAAAPTLMELAL